MQPNPETHVDERFDIEYVKKLFEDLKRPTGAKKQEVLKALEENIALVQLPEANAEGTAIRLCDSGYYLTAAHVVIEQSENNVVPTSSRVALYIPQIGSLALATTLIFDRSVDLAILFAPTGRKRAKIPNLQIANAPLAPNEKLWLLGLEPLQESTHATLGIPYGYVDTSLEQRNYLGENVYNLVKGMIPYGGSSGGPIIDSKGKIVAVESGYYVQGGRLADRPTTRADYTHAIVTPLANLDRLYRTKVQALPLTQP